MRQPIIVFLTGGPPEIPRTWAAPDGDEVQVKIPRGNGYEHFAFSGEYVELDGDLIPVYRWCYRTFIAE
jgi:Family of unknown function (DUF5988)